MQLADEHPDYELIEARVLEKQKMNGKKEPKSNVIAEENSNANGNTPKELQEMFVKEMKKADRETNNFTGAEKPTRDKHMDMILVGGLIFLSAILIYKTA